MVRRPDKESSLEVRPAIGGIQTKYPSPICIPSQTPDALNVLYHRRTTLRRDGCVPINRYLPPRNSLRNQGRTQTIRHTGTNTNRASKVVPGYGFVGHRDHFNDYDDGTNTTFTVSFLTTPEPTGDDPNEQANWFVFNENAGAANTYAYRPILSKGPLRATRCALGERTAFSIFVYNLAGEAAWGCYVQSNIGAAPILLRSNAGDRTNPKPFHTYRITLSITATGNHPAGNGQAILSVAELMGDGAVVRNSYTQALTGRIPMNQCPLLFFDMPRAQIEAPALNGGLNIATGYWRNALRYEGRLQDVSYWSVDKTNNGGDFTFAETMTPLDTSVTQAGLLGHWAPETHTYYNRGPASWKEDQTLIPESRGLDAPIMLGPNVPIWQRINGKTGLYFDGRTSYAFMPTSVNAASSPLTVAVVGPIITLTVVDGSRFADKVGLTLIIGVGTATEEVATIQSVAGNVITLTANTAAAHAIGDYVSVYGGDRNGSYISGGALSQNSYESMVLGGTGGISESIHTIQVTFIPDSFEYRADDGVTETIGQTIFRWGGVCDIGITTRGRPYCLPWGNAGFPAFAPGTHAAANTLVPGQRYTILYSRNGDLQATLYVNGRLQLTVVATAPIAYMSPGAAQPPGLPSFILGCSESAAGSTILEDIGATDPELHFVGRIEDVRVGNQRVLNTNNEDPFLGLNRDLTESELYIDAQKLAAIDDFNATGLSMRRTTNVATFLFVHAQGIVQTYTKRPFYSDQLGRVLVTEGTVTDTAYTLLAAPMGPSTGFDDVRDRKVRLSFFLGWWNFEENTLESKLESRYRDHRETGAVPAQYHFYQQDLAVPDKLGFSFPLTLRSREPDVEMIAAALAAVFTWKDTSPWELIPRVAAGLVPALPSTNPITLIAQFKTRETRTLAAAANSIYWLKPPWQKGESPYPLDADPDPYSLFASGRMRNHIRIPVNSTWDLSNADLTIEFWMKVPELGIRREIALNWSGANVGQYNWRVVLTEYGALQVSGYVGGVYWRISTADAASPAAGDYHTPIVPGRWHHIAITIDVSAIANDRIWIDGTAQPMNNPRGAHAAGWDGGQGFKWIAGHAIELGSPDVTNETFAEPFFGYLRDFRVSTGLRYTTNFVRPRTPLTADGTTVTLLPLNEGEDLSASATGSTVARGTIRMEEMLPILDGSLLCSNSSERFPYSWTQYLDVLYVTNGLGAPLAIRSREFVGPRPRSQPPAGGTPRPFGLSVGRYGVSQPGFDIPRLIGQVPVAASPVFTNNAPITVAVSFVSEDGIESNPQVYDLTVPDHDGAGPILGWTRLILDGIPRSLEPHVVQRRIYTGATAPTLVEPEERMADNLSDETELLTIAGTGPDVEVNKAAPPPARFVTIFRGQSYLLNQPLVAPLELYVSEPLNVAVGTTVENFNFPSGIFRLEEGGTGHGTSGTFLAEHLGSLFCGKRDSIFQVGISNLLNNYSLQRIGASKGFAAGHSVTVFDNHLFGAMEKGVHVFDAAGIDYIAEDLEGIWSTVDKSETAMLLMHGVYHEPTNQYWLTIRRQGETFGREIVVFDKVTQDPRTGRHPWSLLKTVKHSYLAKVEDEVDDSPLLFLGTPDGQVMQMLVGQVDGSRPPNNPATGTAFTLAGTATAGSTTTLTMAGAAFDTLGHGLRGLWVTVTHLNGVVEEARILSNTGTQLTFETALGATVASGDTFEIGAYWAYQSTPWLPLTSMSQMKIARWLDFDFTPNAGNLLVQIVVGGGTVVLNDPFPWAVVPIGGTNGQQSSLLMARGYHEMPCHWQDERGFYFRMAFGTRGISKPFEVFGWNVAFDEDGLRKGRQ